MLNCPKIWTLVDPNVIARAAQAELKVGLPFERHVHLRKKPEGNETA
jgi:hypothetical protein